MSNEMQPRGETGGSLGIHRGEIVDLEGYFKAEFSEKEVFVDNERLV